MVKIKEKFEFGKHSVVNRIVNFINLPFLINIDEEFLENHPVIIYEQNINPDYFFLVVANSKESKPDYANKVVINKGKTSVDCCSIYKVQIEAFQEFLDQYSYDKFVIFPCFPVDKGKKTFSTIIQC
ncbi:hypothetical protein [Mycoplasma leonicaptivi]|uniref:hypothetical protein n=1 Tax=Mycoplasma leonicaptivi TaxID=36742 RepID=UPI0004825B02|nr:hypothetical protein [Mycoplasma leonicaptivi]